MTLDRLIASKKARIGVLGLGYVGLPLAVEFARAGFKVTGYEILPERTRAVRAGRSYIPDVPSGILKGLVRDGRLTATGSFDSLGSQDAVVVCVPTPLRKTRDPDVSHILSATEALARHVRKGQLIVLESTTYPGTTREMVLPRLQRKGLREGRDFFLAFSPERVDPGNRMYRIPNTPKVVGGLSPASTRAASLLYGQIVRQVVEVSSAEAAEMVKLVENTFRAVNIGLVNEVALMCDRLGLDVWEVVDAAKTKPFGFMPFFPGPGLGGHCIPVDPHYLSWKMKSLNFEARFIELAGAMNSSMPEHVVERVGRLLNGRSKPVKGSRVLVLGAAYKSDVSDVRESPALDVMKLLMDEGARVEYHDPFVDKVRIGPRVLRSVRLTPASLKAADCVVILTAHTGLDYARVVKGSKLVFDTRNATKGLSARNLHRL